MIDACRRSAGEGKRQRGGGRPRAAAWPSIRTGSLPQRLRQLPATDVVCLADAGWFPLIESPYNGQKFHVVQRFGQGGIAAITRPYRRPMRLPTTTRAPPGTARYHRSLPPTSRHRCSLSTQSTTPFRSQTRSDAAATRPTSLRSKLRRGRVYGLGAMLTVGVKSWLALPQAKVAGHAAFISACYFHCGSHATWGLYTTTAAVSLARKAFAQWMTQPEGPARTMGHGTAVELHQGLRQRRQHTRWEKRD